MQAMSSHATSSSDENSDDDDEEGWLNHRFELGPPPVRNRASGSTLSEPSGLDVSTLVSRIFTPLNFFRKDAFTPRDFAGNVRSVATHHFDDNFAFDVSYDCG